MDVGKCEDDLCLENERGAIVRARHHRLAITICPMYVNRRLTTRVSKHTLTEQSPKSYPGDRAMS